MMNSAVVRGMEPVKPSFSSKAGFWVKRLRATLAKAWQAFLARFEGLFNFGRGGLWPPAFCVFSLQVFSAALSSSWPLFQFSFIVALFGHGGLDFRVQEAVIDQDAGGVELVGDAVFA